jgi:DnaJ-class molecular chaperone
MNLAQALDYFNLESLEGYSFERLKADYKSLAKKYHPDTNEGNHQAFVKLRQAYHIISDNLALEQKRPSSNNFRVNNKNKTNASFSSQENDELQIQLQILYGETKNASIEAQNKFQNLWDEFNKEREVLLNKMETDLSKLKSQSVMNKIFFWRKDSLIKKNLDYQIKLNEYQQKLYDLDTSYLKEVVKMYSEVLNHLNHIISPESEN